MIKKLTLPFFFVVFCTSLYAQVAGPGDTIVCYFDDIEFPAYVGAPLHFEAGEGPKLSHFDIEYNDVPEAAREAINYAASIWETTLSSDVPIRVEVNWDSLESTALAAAGPTTLYRDFPGALDSVTWYNVALAESILGQELNDTSQADIAVQVNENVNWYYGLDGNTPFNSFDMVSVILHELGHGLGFLSSARMIEADDTPDTTDVDMGAIGFDDIIFVFDYYLETEEGARLVDKSVFPSPSEALLEAFTSGNLFFASPLAAAVNAGLPPRVFAPSEFDEGSSISHLDEFAFRSGEANALMTPRLARAEAIHHPGEITIAILQQIGWNTFLTGVERPALAELPLEVFPNPTAGLLHIQLPEGERETRMQLRVVDLNGRHLINRTVKDLQLRSTMDLDVGRLPSGTYILTLRSPDKMYQAKILRH